MMNGILNIFKPKGISSHQVVREVRNILNIPKVGHTGTLDPSASGVLLLCLGQATKIAEFLVGMKKYYQGEMTLGITTDSQDAEGKIIGKKEVGTDIDEKKIRDIFQKYEGTISQIPPMFSAAHYKGKRLYNLARKGIEVKRSPKKIKIYQFNLINFDQRVNPIVKFEVVCSKGTYIRTLCSDIGKKLGCGACLARLRRLKTGPFTIKMAISLDVLKEAIKAGKWQDYLMDLNQALASFEAIILNEDQETQIKHGRFIFWPHKLTKPLIRALNKQSRLVALVQTQETQKGMRLHPVKVF